MRHAGLREYAGLPSVEVTSELVCLVIVVLTIFPSKRQAHAAKKALRACGVGDEAAVATLARLRAAEMMDAGELLARHRSGTLIEAIATAPLHLVGEYYYFDPEEFLGLLRQCEARAGRRRG